ncbi:hypothetical protein HPB47_027384 [Ixodes persulcatus]|uniref:Uncharacterized protein n=1 Tax=Ixodes persulcatus TaxID=34615 RepID=A0AC60PXL8_IXOPE|nr:hypothetical protein HPB47_027384 [Ixodes persulcatus]
MSRSRDQLFGRLPSPSGTVPALGRADRARRLSSPKGRLPSSSGGDRAPRPLSAHSRPSRTRSPRAGKGRRRAPPRTGRPRALGSFPRPPSRPGTGHSRAAHGMTSPAPPANPKQLPDGKGGSQYTAPKIRLSPPT